MICANCNGVLPNVGQFCPSCGQRTAGLLPDSFLDAQRSRIDISLASLTSYLEGLKRSDTFDLGAGDRFKDENVTRSISDAESLLLSMKAALHEIDLGVYGACKRCTKGIDSVVLARAPFVSFCPSCDVIRAGVTTTQAVSQLPFFPDMPNNPDAENNVSDSGYEPAELQRVALRELGTGSLWLVGGVGITFLTYKNAPPGGQYSIFYGAMLVGIWQFIRGLYFYLVPSALVRNLQQGQGE